MWGNNDERQNPFKASSPLDGNSIDYGEKNTKEQIQKTQKITRIYKSLSINEVEISEKKTVFKKFLTS